LRGACQRITDAPFCGAKSGRNLGDTTSLHPMDKGQDWQCGRNSTPLDLRIWPRRGSRLPAGLARGRHPFALSAQHIESTET